MVAGIRVPGRPARRCRSVAHDKIDIVNVDFVADAIATLHQKAEPQYDTYHLSSGAWIADLPRSHTSARGGAATGADPYSCRFLEKPFAAGGEYAGQPQRIAWPTGHRLMKVFMPYLVWNTVFDNTRVTAELGKQAGAVLAVQLLLCSNSAAKTTSPITTSLGPAAQRREDQPHDGLRPGSLGQQHHRSPSVSPG